MNWKILIGSVVWVIGWAILSLIAGTNTPGQMVGVVAILCWVVYGLLKLGGGDIDDRIAVLPMLGIIILSIMIVIMWEIFL